MSSTTCVLPRYFALPRVADVVEDASAERIDRFGTPIEMRVASFATLLPLSTLPCQDVTDDACVRGGTYRRQEWMD